MKHDKVIALFSDDLCAQRVGKVLNIVSLTICLVCAAQHSAAVVQFPISLVECGSHLIMALDPDDEWLNELLEPKPKRQPNSDDDIEAAEFLHEMLTSFSSASVPSLHVAPVPKQILAQPALPTAMPAPLAARRCVSTARIADRPARPADRIRVGSISNNVAAASRKPVEA